MVYRHAAYEEYLKASKFAKVRYKYGVYIQIIAFILLLFLLFYVVSNVEELKTNPIKYTEEKLNVKCICYENNLLQPIDNGDARST
jgi:large-conductance mechanosensitive channel